MTRIAILLVPLLLQAQTPVYRPSIAIAASEYREAQDAWIRNDPNLVNDLFKGNKEEVRGRIHRAATLRDNVMAKKEVYLGLLIQRIEDSQKRLTSSSGPNASVPVDEIKSGVAEEQTRILSDQDRLEALLRDLPQGDDYSLVRRELEKERADLITLQNALAQRLRSLDNAARSQQAVHDLATTDPLGEQLESVKKVWEQEHQRIAGQRADWARYYSSLVEAIDTKGSPAPGKTRVSKTAAPPSPPIPEQKILDGQWIYRSEPGAWSGPAEPEAVSLSLHLGGGQVSGTYEARIPIRGDLRRIRLTLTGKTEDSSQARIAWSSSEPAAHGEINLKLAADGRLFVQVLNSTDNYVPTGTAVLVPR